MRSTHRLFLSATVAAICGCSPEMSDGAGPSPSAALVQIESAFGPRGTALFGDYYGFDASASADGFVTRPESFDKALRVEIPTRPTAPTVVSTLDGFRVSVSDKGRLGAAEPMGGAVGFARERGTSVWVTLDSGAEEWLYFPGGAPEREVARYALSGGEARQHGAAVDIYDGSGRARITVSAPEVLAASGEIVNARVVLEETELAVVLDRTVDGPLMVDPAWVPAGDMGVPRDEARAVVLPSGNVLVVGGYTSVVDTTATAERFDVATGTWMPTPSTAQKRSFHTLTLLADGRVMVLSTSSSFLTGAQVYDEASDAWSACAATPVDRGDHSATLLPDGRVLVIGGGSNSGKLADYYDPSIDGWTAAASSSAKHSGHNAFLLSNGDVFVNGATMESYSPATDSWTTKASAPVAVPSNGVRVSDTVLMFYGVGNSHTDVLAYETETDIWSYWAPSSGDRGGQSPASLLGTDSWLVSGGYDSGAFLKSTEVFDTVAETWSSGPDLADVRAGHISVTLQDGRILVAGGYFGSVRSSVEVLTPGSEMGSACQQDAECASGYCVEGVCCNLACNLDCQHCSVAMGAVNDGQCHLTTGGVCDDGDVCTTSETCSAGQCIGTPVTCTASGPCMFSSCKAPAGCGESPVAPGSPCPGGHCSFAGVCVPAGGQGGGGASSGSASAGGSQDAASSGGGEGVGGNSGAGAASSGESTGGGMAGGPSAPDNANDVGGCSVAGEKPGVDAGWALVSLVAMAAGTRRRERQRRDANASSKLQLTASEYKRHDR